MAKKTFKVKLISSPIGRAEKQKRTAYGLGLKRLNQVSEIEDTPSNRGMAAKIPHMVVIVE